MRLKGSDAGQRVAGLRRSRTGMCNCECRRKQGRLGVGARKFLPCMSCRWAAAVVPGAVTKTIHAANRYPGEMEYGHRAS
jgi:hypothetical protein